VTAVWCALGLVLATLDAHGGSPTQGLRGLAERLLVPLGRGLGRAVAAGQRVADGLAYEGDAGADLERLRADNERLRAELSRLRAALADQGLHDLVAASDRHAGVSIPALVVGREPVSWFERVRIDRGLGDGVRPDDAVVTGDGLVGRVVSATGMGASVMLMSSPASSVAVVTEQSGEHGIASGTGLGSALVIEYLHPRSTVAPGEGVVTSGVGGVFPRGLPVGTVTSVEDGADGLTKTAGLEPAADLQRLDAVLVVSSGAGGL